MAWYSKATRREIRPGANDPAIKVVGAILHVDAGNVRDLFGYFNGPSGGIESHFQIAKDGTVFQYRDTGREADANYKANSFLEGGVRKGYVSIETQGLEAGEWTDAQITAIKALLVWLSKEHGFPLRRCKTPTTPGVGYHTLFGAPSAWTPVSKSCPGPKRKAQFAEVLEPWMARASAPAKPVKPQLPKFPGTQAFKIGFADPAVTVLGRALKQLGFDKHHDGNGYQPGPIFTRFDRANVADFQRSHPVLRLDPDGIPGPLTWEFLMDAIA